MDLRKEGAMGKDQFRHYRQSFWYWYKVAATVASHVMIVFAFTDKGFIFYLSLSIESLMHFSIWLLFLYGVYWKAMNNRKPKEIHLSNNRKEIGEAKENLESVKVQLTTGHSIIFSRKDPDQALEQAKYIGENFLNQPKRVWEDIRDLYNSKKFRKPDNNFNPVRLYAIGKINQLDKAEQKKKKPLKNDEVVELSI